MLAYYGVVLPSQEQVLSQLRKGVLEYCVLAELTAAPSYGHVLAAELSKRGVLFASGGALYPVLSRLRDAQWVVTHWEESSVGPPRKYYSVTDTGQIALKEFTDAWSQFSADVTQTLSIRSDTDG